MEKKYELVAWTENVNHPENARLYMIPSLDWEMQAPYFNEIGECHSAMRDNKGVINVGLARKLAKAYEDKKFFRCSCGAVCYDDVIFSSSLRSICIT